MEITENNVSEDQEGKTFHKGGTALGKDFLGINNPLKHVTLVKFLFEDCNLKILYLHQI